MSVTIEELNSDNTYFKQDYNLYEKCHNNNPEHLATEKALLRAFGFDENVFFIRTYNQGEFFIHKIDDHKWFMLLSVSIEKPNYIFIDFEITLHFKEDNEDSLNYFKDKIIQDFDFHTRNIKGTKSIINQLTALKKFEAFDDEFFERIKKSKIINSMNQEEAKLPYKVDFNFDCSFNDGKYLNLDYIAYKTFFIREYDIEIDYKEFEILKPFNISILKNIFSTDSNEISKIKNIITFDKNNKISKNSLELIKMNYSF